MCATMALSLHHGSIEAIRPQIVMIGVVQVAATFVVICGIYRH